MYRLAAALELSSVLVEQKETSPILKPPQEQPNRPFIYLQSLFLIDRDHSIIASSFPSDSLVRGGDTISPKKFLSLRPPYVPRQLFSGGKQGMGNYIPFVSEKGIVYFADFFIPIYDSSNETVIAALGMRIDVSEDLNILVQHSQYGLSGETYLINSYGASITPRHSSPEMSELPGEISAHQLLVDQLKQDSQSNPLVQEIIRTKPGLDGVLFQTEPYKNPRGNMVVGGGLWIEAANCGLITEVDNEEITGIYRKSFNVILIILILSALFSLSFAITIDRLRLQALDYNALSHLPGNRAIKNAVTKAINGNVPRTVVYCDLDNFKAYNDAYGFAEGDNVIQFTGEVISQACKHSKARDYFIGHIGGDDFVFIAHSDYLEEICGRIVDRFDHGIRAFYRSDDLEKGLIESKDRQGQLQKYPIMTISMAGVDLSKKAFEHHLEVSETCAELKKQAKKYNGSILFIDRRK